MDSGLSKLSYEEFLLKLKERIRNAQVKAALAVNQELVLLYWERDSLSTTAARMGVKSYQPTGNRPSESIS